jgi:hypothetical protein
MHEGIGVLVSPQSQDYLLPFTAEDDLDREVEPHDLQTKSHIAPSFLLRR